jgi:CubicO group peptidase (beta-lactamase class C family)
MGIATLVMLAGGCPGAPPRPAPPSPGAETPAAAAVPDATPARAPDEPVIGLWGADLDFGPALAGTLELRATSGKAFEATFGAAHATVRDDHGELRGTFLIDGADAGQLRLRRAGRDRLVGHWIQPASFIHSQRYATPIALTRAAGAAGTFRGEVAPLREEIHHYLTIESRDGHLVAWIRETEKNLGRFQGDLRLVPRDDGAFAFLREDGSEAFTARLADPAHLVVTIEDVAQPLVHTRRGRADAPGFYAAPATPWTYQPPAAGADQWPVATLADVGLDLAVIAPVIQGIRDTTPTSWRTPAVHALLVARHGKLVLEEYFAGHDATRTHDLRSAGKTLNTTLLGIAIDRRLLTLDDPIDRFAPPALPRHPGLLLRHLASMSSGLDCDDHDDRSPGNEDRMQQQSAQPDWYAYMLALAQLHPPGTKGVYCTGGINLIGRALAATTHRWIPDLFAEWYAAPLGMTGYRVNLMPGGDGYLGGGFRLRPRDFAKLPQLVLDGGVWRGHRVVSAAWLADATAAHTSLELADDYGYGWWRRTLRIGDRDVDVVYASGNGGQIAVAIPALDLVITINGGNYSNFPAWRGFLENLVPAIAAAAAPTTSRR